MQTAHESIHLMPFIKRIPQATVTNDFIRENQLRNLKLLKFYSLIILGLGGNIGGTSSSSILLSF